MACVPQSGGKILHFRLRSNGNKFPLSDDGKTIRPSSYSACPTKIQSKSPASVPSSNSGAVSSCLGSGYYIRSRDRRFKPFWKNYGPAAFMKGVISSCLARYNMLGGILLGLEPAHTTGGDFFFVNVLQKHLYTAMKSQRRRIARRPKSHGWLRRQSCTWI